MAKRFTSLFASYFSISQRVSQYAAAIKLTSHKLADNVIFILRASALCVWR